MDLKSQKLCEGKKNNWYLRLCFSKIIEIFFRCRNYKNRETLNNINKKKGVGTTAWQREAIEADKWNGGGEKGPGASGGKDGEQTVKLEREARVCHRVKSISGKRKTEQEKTESERQKAKEGVAGMKQVPRREKRVRSLISC